MFSVFLAQEPNAEDTILASRCVAKSVNAMATQRNVTRDFGSGGILSLSDLIELNIPL